MKPNAATHNTDPQYFRDLCDSTQLSRVALSKKLGIDDRTLRRYLSGERRVKYVTQFAVECLVFEP